VADEANKQIMDELIKIIKTIQYGSVSLIINDGKIVQIEKNEKVKVK